MYTQEQVTSAKGVSIFFLVFLSLRWMYHGQRNWFMIVILQLNPFKWKWCICIKVIYFCIVYKVCLFIFYHQFLISSTTDPNFLAWNCFRDFSDTMQFTSSKLSSSVSQMQEPGINNKEISASSVKHQFNIMVINADNASKVGKNTRRNYESQVCHNLCIVSSHNL